MGVWSLEAQRERYRRQEAMYHRGRLDTLLNDLDVDRAAVELRLEELKSDGGYDAAIAELRLAFFRLGVARDHVRKAYDRIAVGP